MWSSYLKTALRSLIRNRRLSVINLSGLTIGLAFFIIIVSWIINELSFDRFHKNRDRIFQLTIRHPEGILDPNCPYAIAPEMLKQFPEVDSYCTVMNLAQRSNSSFSFNYDSPARINVYESDVARVDTTFFKIFDFPLVYGQNRSLLEKPGFVVISTEIANKYFNDSNPVGQNILYNNSQLLTISGVVDIPENTTFNFDFFLPVFENLSNNWNWMDPSFILLKQGIDVATFSEKIASFMNDILPEDIPLPRSFVLGVTPVRKVHLAFGQKRNVILFGTVAFLLLIVAALNYINLAGANYLGRRMHETGMRKVLGAKKSQLLFVFFAESIILVFSATVLAMVLARVILPAMSPIFGRQIEIAVFHNPEFLAGLIVIIGLISLLASFYPSTLYTGVNPVDLTHRAVKSGGLRSAVVLIAAIFQFTLSIALLIFTLIVIRQIRFSSHEDLGFSYSNMVSVRMNRGLNTNLRAFIEQLESHPGIEIATAGQAFPFNEDIKTGGLGWSLKEPQTMDLWRYSICLNNYPDAFDFKLASGRLYSDEPGADRGKYVINEAAARMLGFEDPVGQQITMWGRKGEIIGVVKDFHHVSLHKEILPHIFNVDSTNFQSLKYIFIKLNTGPDKEILSYIESVCNDFAPGFPFSYSFMEDEYRHLYTTDANLSRILGLFAVITIILSGLSIYGLAYSSVEKKSGEIAVRKVFGAGLPDILSLIFTSLLSRIGISFFIAAALSLVVAGKWLQTFAYRISPDVMVFIIPALLALIIAGLATLFAMWRPVRQNPAYLLKQE